MAPHLGRIVVDDVRPRTPSGWPAKAVVGEAVPVSADIFRDGHDVLAARVRWWATGDGAGKWRETAMTHTVNDRWEATIEADSAGAHEFVVEAWTDRWATWHHKFTVKLAAGQDVALEREEGARLLESRQLAVEAAALRAGDDAPADDPIVEERMAGPEGAEDITPSEVFPLWVDRPVAAAGAWYEVFPRSDGGLAGLASRLRDIKAMGFDVVYLPPIHPIGQRFRKGRNNTLAAGPDDPGSPWAIGGAEGGHTAIHPDLGTFTDFGLLVERAEQLGLEIALDYALQCSPDHPWVRDHPEWFHARPDGSIAYAENPPKKYQDIYPINFWPAAEADRVALWEACKEILEFWIDKGIRIFRVDNPHTKPLAFWAWVIGEVQSAHPDVAFLAEAFTRPKMMSKLAEVGFTQSYTYFTWRTSAWELRTYVEELAHTPLVDWFRPNFWPNTPDILSGPLRNGNAATFRLRLALAAFLAPSYGIYNGYELLENEPASPDNEEYLNSEKYETKQRDWNVPWSLAPFITKVNEIRHRHPAFARLPSTRFHHSANENFLAWSKRSDDGQDTVLVVVNLDPHHAQETTLALDLSALGVRHDQPFDVVDEITGQRFTWFGPNPYVRLDPQSTPAHVLHVLPRS